MSKDYDDYDDEYDERGGNKDYYDYDDEISRKAVGKLLNGLDDEKKPSKAPAKAMTVKAIRPESEGEGKRSSINTSYYDESRTSRYEDDDDEIVTGFRDDDEDDYYSSHDNDEYDDDTEQMELEELREMEEPEPVRSRRPRPGSEETPADRQERDRYRRQFLDGYTDTRKKSPESAQPVDHRRRSSGAARPTGASADDAVRRIAAEKEKDQEESAPRRRPRPTGAEPRPQPQRGRRAPETENDDEINIIPKRGERIRKERTPAAAPGYGAASASPSYDAPIFKIIILAFVIMLLVMIFLVFKINAANKSIAEYENNIEQTQADAETLTLLKTANDGLREQITTLTGEKGALVLERDALQKQVDDLQGPQTGTNPPSATGAPAANQPTLPGGSTSYTVVSGDSLSRISTRFLGDSSAANIAVIKQANNMTNDVIHVGQTLIIPQR